MSEGIDEGFSYSRLHESVESFAKDAGNKALDEHIGNFYKTVRDDEGVLIKRRDEDPIAILEKVSEEAAKRRKGKKFKYDKMEFYEQHDKRAKRAGL